MTNALNETHDVNLKSFREKLCRILINNKIIEDEETIKISTMHSSKGMEEDIVILLEANENILESVHPDNELFEIFGDNLETALEDQKRLFYVAITRAREKVYLLYEKDKEYLFTGDLVYIGTLFSYFPSTDPEAYLSSLERVAALPVKRVFPAHHDLSIQPSILGEMKDAFAGLKADGKLHHGSGTFQYNNFAVWL